MDRWDQIEKIFAEVLELPGNKRAAFLRQSCGSDENLFRQLESLLANDLRAGEHFLEPSSTPVQPAHRPDNTDELVNQRLGAYTISQHIASGGMGTVYLAEQDRPRRPVAMKVLRAAFLTPTIEKRFDTESRILGYLRHPNIAQVYEAGSHRLESGATINYFAMEFVPEARTITKYASENSLSLTGRLDLFLQLCEAVQHGHQKGVIHRDLKPGNVLVDRDGRVKVIDFGIARTIDSDMVVTTLHTEAGQLLGTLAYMSPEQCAADPSQVDTTTDIYSLGVILYELLTGRMPYDVSNMTIHAAARVICEHEPARPSHFDKRLRGDAETVVLKAIEKDRSKRYQSASDLAGDIRLFLNGEPISARPPTAFSRLIRWAARHPKAATAVACSAIGALVFVATSISLYFIDRRPDRLEVTPDGSAARMVTWRGRPLEPTWDSGKAAGIQFAETAVRPDTMGGERVAVLGFTGLSRVWPGSLCVFDTNRDRSRPIWEHNIGGHTQNTGRGSTVSDVSGFEFYHGTIADVFPETQSPGSEIVAIFSHRYSQRVLQILDLAGRVRYQAMQDGGIWSPYWMKRLNLLVFSGADENLKHKPATDGLLIEQAIVVFAIRPRDGFITSGKLDPSSPVEELRPTWYRYLHPASTERCRLAVVISEDTGGYDPASNAGLSVRAIGENSEILGSFLMVVNEQGEELLGARHPDDSWTANEAKLPELRKFALCKNPPLALDASTRPASGPHPAK